MSTQTETLVERTIHCRDHIKTFEDTVLVAVQDGRLEPHEIDAVIGCLNHVQVDIGKLIYRLQQMRLQILPIASTGIELDIRCGDDAP